MIVSRYDPTDTCHSTHWQHPLFLLESRASLGWPIPAVPLNVNLTTPLFDNTKSFLTVPAHNLTVKIQHMYVAFWIRFRWMGEPTFCVHRRQALQRQFVTNGGNTTYLCDARVTRVSAARPELKEFSSNKAWRVQLNKGYHQSSCAWSVAPCICWCRVCTLCCAILLGPPARSKSYPWAKNRFCRMCHGVFFAASSLISTSFPTLWISVIHGLMRVLWDYLYPSVCPCIFVFHNFSEPRHLPEETTNIAVTISHFRHLCHAVCW